MTLWEMVTGKAPFQGTAGEVMHQHQHAALPLDLMLRGMPIFKGNPHSRTPRKSAASDDVAED
jgi:hypothetical protein